MSNIKKTRPTPNPTAAPVPQTRDALAKLLVDFGVSILKTVCQPEVLTVFRLAIAESDLLSSAESCNGKRHTGLLVQLPQTKRQERTQRDPEDKQLYQQLPAVHYAGGIH